MNVFVDNVLAESDAEAEAEASESPVRSANGSGLSVFRHNIRKSIGDYLLIFALYDVLMLCK